ncbi:MAG: polysaccharide deacetylase family protein [Marinilabilia sp.]
MPLIKKLFFFDLRYSGFPSILRKTLQRNKTTILAFHRPAPGHFEKITRWLKQKYNIIPLSQYIEGTSILPRSLVLTFDDGWADNYSLLPVIEKHQLPVTIFLTAGIANTNRHPWFWEVTDKKIKQELKTMSDAAKKAYLKQKGFEETREFDNRLMLNKTEIQDMQAGGLVTFGSHTMFHPILPRCSDALAAREINLSKTTIEELTGRPCEIISFPNGEYSERDIRLCKKAGFKAAVTLEPGVNGPGTDPFRLKRISAADAGSVSEISVRASGLWNFLKVISGRQKRSLRHDGL